MAQTAYTTPVGYVTNSLNQGYNPIGLNLHSSVVATGILEAVSGTTLTDSNGADLTSVLPAGRTFVLEITAGAGLGATQEFTTRTATTMDLPGSIGAALGSSYNVRIAPTLEEIFGTTTSLLKKSNVAGNADNVLVPNGLGGYIRYFLNSAGVWRNATTPGLAPNTPLVYLDGIFVQKVDAAVVNIVVSGQVKTKPTLSSITQGFNLLSTVYPVGSTLQNLGMDSALKKSNVAGNADNVLFPDGAGGYVRYFLNSAGVWRNATNPGLAPANLPITSAIFIERKDLGAVPLNFVPPSFYSNL